MRKDIFIKIMNEAIRSTANDDNNGWYTCLNLSWASSKILGIPRYEDRCDDISKDYYRMFFGKRETTWCVALRKSDNETIKQTRLAALRLYKLMMLDTKAYKGL